MFCLDCLLIIYFVNKIDAIIEEIRKKMFICIAKLFEDFAEEEVAEVAKVAKVAEVAEAT